MPSGPPQSWNIRDSREGGQEEEVVRVLEHEDRHHVARLPSKSFRIALFQITLTERTNVAVWS